MQLHCGSFRNHNSRIYAGFGPDRGFDIPIAADYTRNLHPLLERFGDHPALTLILFTLDESAYPRLAPLPAPICLRLGRLVVLRLMERNSPLFDRVIETAASQHGWF
jgi:glucuronate isomerase